MKFKQKVDLQQKLGNVSQKKVTHLKRDSFLLLDKLAKQYKLNDSETVDKA